MIVRIEEDTLGRLRQLARDFGVSDAGRYTRCADLRRAIEAAYMIEVGREQLALAHAEALPLARRA